MNLVSRRGFLAGSACLVAAGPAYSQISLPPSNINFRVLRDGSEIGFSHVTFERVQNNLTVRCQLEIDVKLGPITLYRYQQTIVERWTDNQFQSADGQTNDDGTNLVVKIQRDGDQLIVDSTKLGHQTVAGNAMLATYWNRTSIDGPMLGTEEGKILCPTVTAGSWEQIGTPPTPPIEARRFTLSGDLKMDLWYDTADQWRGLRLHARDGSVIQYVMAAA